MREILKFEDNNILFSLDIKEGRLFYQKKENDIIYSDLKNEEINFINDVFSCLMPSSNIKDLGIIKCNSKEINHLYDLDNKYHLFFEGEKEVTKDCLQLNYIFNNQEEYVNNYNYDRNYSSKFVKRRVIIGKKVLSVVVSSAFLLTSSLFFIKGGQKIINFVESYRYNQKVEEYSNRQIEINEIINAINDNKNLTDVEKEFFLSCRDFFEDNIEYFDYYTVLDYLKRLRIEYIPDKQNSNVYGEFTATGSNRGLIKIYNATSFEDSDKYILSHEFLHVFTKYSNDNNSIYEGLNVLLNNEYFGVNNILYDSGYPSLRKYIYILSELIDPNTLKQYHADNDINYLKNSLIEIIPDENMALDLLLNIDFIYKCNELKNTDLTAYLKLEEEYNMKNKEVINSLKTYYEIKYKTLITEDLNIYFWFNPQNACAKIACELELDRNCILQADKFTKIKQFKKIFNKNGSDNLILSICDELKEVPKNYTLEEVLNGDTGFLYRTKEEIDLKEVSDGVYQGTNYEPINYIDYEVIPSYKKDISINK